MTLKSLCSWIKLKGSNVMKLTKAFWKTLLMPLVYAIWGIGSVVLVAAVIIGIIFFCAHFPIAGISIVCFCAYCIAMNALQAKDWPWRE